MGSRRLSRVQPDVLGASVAEGECIVVPRTPTHPNLQPTGASEPFVGEAGSDALSPPSLPAPVHGEPGFHLTRLYFAGFEPVTEGCQLIQAPFGFLQEGWEALQRPLLPGSFAIKGFGVLVGSEGRIQGEGDRLSLKTSKAHLRGSPLHLTEPGEKQVGFLPGLLRVLGFLHLLPDRSSPPPGLLQGSLQQLGRTGVRDAGLGVLLESPLHGFENRGKGRCLKIL